MIKKMPQKKRADKTLHFHPIGAAFGSGFITGVTSHLFNFFAVLVIMIFSFAILVAVLNFEPDLPMFRAIRLANNRVLQDRER